MKELRSGEGRRCAEGYTVSHRQSQSHALLSSQFFSRKASHLLTVAFMVSEEERGHDLMVDAAQGLMVNPKSIKYRHLHLLANEGISGGGRLPTASAGRQKSHAKKATEIKHPSTWLRKSKGAFHLQHCHPSATKSLNLLVQTLKKNTGKPAFSRCLIGVRQCVWYSPFSCFI